MSTLDPNVAAVPQDAITTTTTTSQTKLLHAAKLAESCGLHAEAFALLSTHVLATAGGGAQGVDTETRTQLSLSLVNLTHPWRLFISRVPPEETSEELDGLRKTIFDRLVGVKNTIVELSDHLVGNDAPPETAVWAFKMKGDLHRYVAEAASIDASISTYEARAGEQAFADGLRRAQLHLPPTSPLRLGLALNYGAFCYDVLHDADRARRIAQDALDECDAEMHAFDVPQNLPDTNYVSQLVRKALVRWEDGGEGGAG